MKRYEFFPQFTSRLTKITAIHAVVLISGAGWASFWVDPDGSGAAWIVGATIAGVVCAIVGATSLSLDYVRWEKGNR